MPREANHVLYINQVCPVVSVVLNDPSNDCICIPNDRGELSEKVIGELIDHVYVVVNAEEQRAHEIISALQLLLHPSPLFALPSSHCSVVSWTPLPQIAVDPELTSAIPQ